jgi:dTDP-glucose 4,6-dehydratase/UDP-glucuronate decarboxylase
VIPDFARNVLDGRNIVMLSDGAPTMTFCYVADAVVGYYKVLTKGRNGDAYNIGAEAPEISIAGLAEKVVEIAGSCFGYKGKVIRQVSPDDSIWLTIPTRPNVITRQTKLGQRASLDEGLKRALIWYRVTGREAGDEDIDWDRICRACFRCLSCGKGHRVIC